MVAKVSLQMVRNVIHAIATHKHPGSYVTFDKNGWQTIRY